MIENYDKTEFEIENGELKKYIGKGIDVTIPKGVKVIGDKAFRFCTSLISVTIPRGVTSIGTGAFYGCTSLTGITLPHGVKSIGAGAFNGCTSLTGVTVPKSIKSIGLGAFWGCGSLAEISFKGAAAGWKTVKKSGIFNGDKIRLVHCTDGDIKA